MLRKVDPSSTSFFAARTTAEATTCFATNLNSTLLIGSRRARQRGKKKKEKKA